ncbi:hypothetical protein [Actinokineospora sp.]|uniref:hypothetical protein n=1 Tax=Actinokineospora sp. TaxID=1872133 RepID=UPI0040378211
MTSGIGQRFVAEVDRAAWRRPLVPWVAAGGAVAVLAVAFLAAGWVPRAVALVALVPAVAGPAAKIGGYVARRRRREAPLTVDGHGVRLPTARGAAFLPWETLRSVTVDGPTLNFRVRAGVTPGTPGVVGLHQRDSWPVASGPGLPVDTRLFTRGREEILAAIEEFSGGRVWAGRG